MIPYNIRNLPPGEQERDILSFLESQPDYGEITFRAETDHASISMAIPYLYAYQYKDYLIEVIPINRELHITCHKVTSGMLISKYSAIREKLSRLNIYLEDFEKEIRLTEYKSRHGERLRSEENIRALKQAIKNELARLGIKVNPGSPLSKILRK